MKSKAKDLFFKNINLIRTTVFVGIVALCVIMGGLFFNSQSDRKQEQQDNIASSRQGFYFTPAQIPDKLDFAGEAVPLNNFDTRESLDRELLSCANFHSQTILFLKKLPRYFKIIEPILKKNNIPDDFKYLALAESSFLDKAISPVGAIGIWQFMKSAALGCGLEINAEVDERYHIEKSTQAACIYLNNSYRTYRNWTLVAASYNAGMNGIERQVELQDSRNYYDLLLNEETARYIFRILALKLVMSDPERYGFKVDDKDKYPIIPTKEIKVTGKITSMVDFAHAHDINYKILKYLNPWLRQTYLKNPFNKTYTLKIPEPGFRKFKIEDQTGSPKEGLIIGGEN
jgi:membrane-bound lytic murein transglycosylase D